MSQDPAAASQVASVRSISPGPPVGRAFSIENVDVTQQERIQAQVTQNLDAAYERAVEEAIRRSLSCSEPPPSPTDTPDTATMESRKAASPGQSSSSSAIVHDMDNCHIGDDNDSGEETLAARETTSAAVSKNTVVSTGNSEHKKTSGDDINIRPDTDVKSNGMVSCAGLNRTGSPDLDADADDEDEDLPRSRRGQYRQRQHQKSERRPSLDRLNGYAAERRPSLDRMHNPASERRPSLERANQYQNERRPSLDRRDNYQSERRPSLERVNDHRSERRPSLERVNDYRSERRPSLDRMERGRRPSLDRMERRQSLERRDGASERRPSLERLQQYGLERRPSLERMQNAAQRLQTLNSREDANGEAQGINTLHPWPLNQQGMPTNWDMTRLPEIETDGLYCLVQLSPVDPEYSAITVDFEEAGLKVHSVERLQNPMLLERFNHEKESLLKMRPPDFELSERYLYHGTQANQHHLCEEGLDHRLSFQGCFGRGIYFSDNPRKCMQYATTSNYNVDSIGTRPMILVCRVLLGDSKVYDHGIKDSNLKREPEKPNAKGGWRYYDSVQGIPVDYPEFVVYDNRRSMIEYVVTFEEVAYRAPPSQYNYYTSQIPALYKVEPIVLPIPEDELDKMYMLGPDTDSDGSCDEHTREVERLRDNVKRGKAKRLGIPFRPPTKEEKRYERLHWKRVCYFSCPPGSPLFEMMIIKKKEEKTERKKRKQQAKEQKDKEEGKEVTPTEEEEAEGAVGGVSLSTDTASEDPIYSVTHTADTEPAEPEDFEVENESVGEVLSTLIADFLNITDTDNVTTARRYIMENSMDLDKALHQYFTDM